MTPLAFIAHVLPAIRTAMPKVHPEVHRLVVAHAALETDWGETKAFHAGRCLFNITRPVNDSRPFVEAGDLEYRPGGEVVRIVQKFAAYPTLEDAVGHYLRFIDRERYRPALEQLMDGDPGYVETLGRGRKRKPADGNQPLGGFYTLPVDEYRRRFDSVLTMVSVLMPDRPEVA